MVSLYKTLKPNKTKHEKEFISSRAEGKVRDNHSCVMHSVTIVYACMTSTIEVTTQPDT